MSNSIPDLVDFPQLIAAPDNLEGRDELLGIVGKLDDLDVRTSDKFKFYDGKYAAEVDKAAAELHAILQSLLTPRLFAECELANSSRNRKAANFRDRVSGPGNNRLKAIAAIGYHSGALQNKGNIHIIDACGGNGVLSGGIAALRNPLRLNLQTFLELVSGKTDAPLDLGYENYVNTHSTCVDIDPKKNRRHEILRRSLGLGNPNLKLRISDFADFTPQPSADRSTYVLGKHTCGSSTDTALARILSWPKDRFPRASLLTCCHTKADKYPFKKGDRNIVVTPEEWATLSRVTNWVDGRYTQQGGPELTPDHRLIGRAAMRVLDLQRVLALPDEVIGEVRELLPQEVLSRNHGISIIKAPDPTGLSHFC